MLRLYELPAAYRVLAERASDGEDVDALLSELDDALEERAANLVAVVRDLEAEATAVRDEEERLAKRRRALEASASRLRGSVRDAMIAGSITRVSCARFAIALRDGPLKVLSIDEAKLPERFWRVRREPDKRAILDALKDDGEVVDGCTVGTEPYLSIR